MIGYTPELLACARSPLCWSEHPARQDSMKSTIHGVTNFWAAAGYTADDLPDCMFRNGWPLDMLPDAALSAGGILGRLTVIVRSPDDPPFRTYGSDCSLIFFFPDPKAAHIPRR
jgi:hypothetical protein